MRKQQVRKMDRDSMPAEMMTLPNINMIAIYLRKS